MRCLLLAFAISAVVLAGCRSLPLATNADSVEQVKYKQDSYECVREADGGTPRFSMGLYRLCMEAWAAQACSGVRPGGSGGSVSLTAATSQVPCRAWAGEQDN